MQTGAFWGTCFVLQGCCYAPHMLRALGIASAVCVLQRRTRSAAPAAGARRM
jgi:hypothetical protein